MNISELKSGILVVDYDGYEFIVGSISRLYSDENGNYIQISTQCGNTVFYREEHWNHFHQICPIHETVMDFKGDRCASCFADQEYSESR